MYIDCIGTEFGTLQIRRHIRSVEIADVEITSVDRLYTHFTLRQITLYCVPGQYVTFYYNSVHVV